MIRLILIVLLASFPACKREQPSERALAIAEAQEQLRRLDAELNGRPTAPSNVTLEQVSRRSGAIESTFRATLMEVPHIPQAGAEGRQAWRVGGDDWLVSLRIDEVLSGEAPFEVGSRQTFLIHSPSRLFHGTQVLNGEFRFRVGWDSGVGGIAVKWLELESDRATPQLPKATSVNVAPP